MLCGVPRHEPPPLSSAPTIANGSDGTPKGRPRNDKRRRGRQKVRFRRAWPLLGHVPNRLRRNAIRHAAASASPGSPPIILALAGFRIIGRSEWAAGRLFKGLGTIFGNRGKFPGGRGESRA